MNPNRPYRTILALRRLWCRLVGHRWVLIIGGQMELRVCRRCGERRWQKRCTKLELPKRP